MLMRAWCCLMLLAMLAGSCKLKCIIAVHHTRSKYEQETTSWNSSVCNNRCSHFPLAPACRPGGILRLYAGVDHIHMHEQHCHHLRCQLLRWSSDINQNVRIE